MRHFLIRQLTRLALLSPLIVLSVITARTQPEKLPVTWRFRIGDDPQWADAGFADSLWAMKNVASSWAATGHKDSVYAWYRTAVVIPSRLKNTIENGGGLKIRLGKIDDVDQTFFNGAQIGQTGGLPPQYETKWDVQRVYTIPPGAVRYDSANVIAVRVFSPDIAGIGMYEGPYDYAPLQWSDHLSIIDKYTPTRNGSVKSSLHILNHGNTPYRGTAEYIISDKNAREIHKEVKTFFVPPGTGKATVIDFAPHQPDSNDFVNLSLRCTEDESGASVTRGQWYLMNKNPKIKTAAVPRPLVRDSIQSRYASLPMSDEQLNGYLGKRMRRNFVERFLTIEEKEMTDPFLRRPGDQPWIGEHIGKYLDAASSAWTYTHDARLKKRMDRMMYALMNTQLADGYLGTYTHEAYWTSWDVWVHKYNLIGLLGYYKATGYEPALAAGKKIGDLLCRTFGEAPGQRDIIIAGEHVGMAATSVLDPMVDLYRYTGEKKYLEFCRYILAAIEHANGPRITGSLKETGEVNRVANGKAYEMLSNILGMTKLYQVTGDESLLKTALIAWQDVALKRLYVTGSTSSAEHFMEEHKLPAGEKDHIAEGCVTVTWLQLSYSLFCLTGDPQFAEQLEKTVYNHLLAAENPKNGAICDYTPLMGKKPFVRTVSCCQSSIPRGIAMIPLFTFGNLRGSPALITYEPASYQDSLVTADGERIGLSMRVAGKFPESGNITITLRPSRKAVFPFVLRVPAWCSTFTARTGDSTYAGSPGEYLSLSRGWSTDDTLSVTIDMPVRTINGGGNYPGRVAFQHGPQILAFDKSLNENLSLDGDTTAYFAHQAALLPRPSRLPRKWEGTQCYSLPASPEAGLSPRTDLMLVPFADAGQTGSEAFVWLPLTLASPAPQLFAPKKERLIYHDIQTDSKGKIIPWYDANPGKSYDHVINLVWHFWDAMPHDMNGLPYYMNHQVWNPSFNDPRGIGGDQFAMALSSWRLYYPYSGNEKVKMNMYFIADYYLTHGLSPADARWPRIPFPYNTFIYSGVYDGDMRAGRDVAQPDKAGSFGLELTRVFKISENRLYLDAATNIANTLAAHLKEGDANYSPLPFKVNVFTGKTVLLRSHDFTGTWIDTAGYTTNWAPTMQLFLDLIELNAGDTASYHSGFQTILKWMKTYPMTQNKWGPFFEDVDWWSETQINAMTFARFIMEHRGYFPDWKSDVQKIIAWVHQNFGNHAWDKFGVTVTNEQTVYQVPANSHSSRQAADELLYVSLTGDSTFFENAVRELHWATYMVDTDGTNRFPQDEPWLTDGYGDYVRHYLRAMDAVPALTAPGQDHIISSTSVVQQADYEGTFKKYIYLNFDKVDSSAVRLFYRTFDAAGTEKIRLKKKPSVVRLDDRELIERASGEGFTWDPMDQGGMLTVKRVNGRKVIVQK